MYDDVLVGLSYEAEDDDDNDSGSPFAALRKQGSKKKIKRSSSKTKPRNKDKAKVSLGGDESRYLRKCPALDNDVSDGGRLVLSGCLN
ncbi:MAG: hypothetical protein SGARI_001720 [Bacillariaceae sp.]